MTNAATNRIVLASVVGALCLASCEHERDDGGMPAGASAGTGAALGNPATAAGNAAMSTAAGGSAMPNTGAPVARDGSQSPSGASPSAGNAAPPSVDAGLAAVDAGGAAAPDPAGAKWETLIEGEWELPPNTEAYRCVQLTLDEDVYAGALEAENPTGTHHTVLTIGEPAGPDGPSECIAGTNLGGGVFGAGVGTGDMVMPDGVAMRFSAGQQLLLNMHLFNTSAQPLKGTSGTLFRRVAADSVEHLAERTIVVATALTLPPGEITTQYGQCTMTQDVTVFALLPHMHQLGIHLKGTVETARGEIVLHDADFDFDNQPIYSIEPVQLAQGDVVHSECTYHNTTDHVVTFGDSSLDEMCNFSLFRYPASSGDGFICAF